MNYGFVKVAAAVPHVVVADCKENEQSIESQILIADSKGAQVVVFPELCLTGYTCGDLFAQQLLLEEAELALMQIMNNTRHLDIISIVGLPVSQGDRLLNGAAVLQHGRILGLVAKTFIPNYKEFYEQRWFSSASHLTSNSVQLCGHKVPVGNNLLFDTPEFSFGIEICEDLWAPIPPSSVLSLMGAEVVFNLSASDDVIGKYHYLQQLVAQQSARNLSGYVYTSSGFGESSTDLVFSGKCFIYENGVKLADNERFSFEEQLVVSEIDVDRMRMERRVNRTFADCCEQLKDPLNVIHINTEQTKEHSLDLTRHVDPLPFVPKGAALDENCNEAFGIQVAGLAKRIQHTHAKTAVLGISGGLDSTLALLVCVKTFDKLGLPRKGILGVTMPGFGTTDRTYNNAISLMQSLGVTIREINIKDACLQHFKDIGHDPDVQDVTYENSQARERTQILMDLANQTGGLVIGTGDLSELALGWATYNGDHMSMYAVNVSIPKTLVRHLVSWTSKQGIDERSQEILTDILNTPISPELIPADENGEISQVTEDLVGPYELHDFFLYYFMRFGYHPGKIYFLAMRAFEDKYSNEIIKKWLMVFFRRFFSQQFKRSCMPDGPKVGSVAISPRGDWRMPSDASSALWLKEIETL